ncbi:hypothetical protein U1Q18_031408 [Sarracenia purpurea var. burkii]
MGSSGPIHSSVVPLSSYCLDLQGRSRSPSFPYYRGWKFSFGPDLSPKHDGTADEWTGPQLPISRNSRWSEDRGVVGSLRPPRHWRTNSMVASFSGRTVSINMSLDVNLYDEMTKKKMKKKTKWV